VSTWIWSLVMHMKIFRSWEIGSINSIRIWALWTVRFLVWEFSPNSPLCRCIPRTYYRRDNFVFNIALHIRMLTKLLSLIQTTCIDLGTFLDTKISSMGFLLHNNHKTSKWRGNTIYGVLIYIYIYLSL
jgi:hypothetical protein